MNRVKNTKEKGVMEFLVYKKGATYIGVCLTFDIVEEDSNPEKLMQSIQEAAQGHLQTVRDKNLSDDLLNRHAPKEYWDIYNEAIKNIQNKKPIKSPYNFVVFPYATRVI